MDAVALRALVSTSDGRLYFQQSNPSQLEIQYYDAGNQIHTLLDDTGLAPLQLRIEHMLYHAPSNALIASQSVTWSGAGCSATANTVYRIPLSLDGSQVSGPITCNTIATGNENLMSLDYLPGDKVLMTIAASSYANKFLSVDPVTLGMTPWAT